VQHTANRVSGPPQRQTRSIASVRVHVLHDETRLDVEGAAELRARQRGKKIREQELHAFVAESNDAPRLGLARGDVFQKR
jgi:hypothetical protein